MSSLVPLLKLSIRHGQPPSVQAVHLHIWKDEGIKRQNPSIYAVLKRLLASIHPNNYYFHCIYIVLDIRSNLSGFNVYEKDIHTLHAKTAI